MKIGFIHSDYWPLKGGNSVQSWQIYSGLTKSHLVFTHSSCPFPGAKCIYRDKRDILKFISTIDLIFIIVDGYFNFSNEKFSMFSMLKKRKIPVVWLINAPLEESLLFPWLKHQIFFNSIQRKFFAKFVDGAISISQEVDKYVKNELGIKKSIVIPNGSDPKHFNPSLHKKTYLDEFKEYYKVVWAGVGSYPWQGIDLIVRTAEKIEKISKKIIFIILSDDSHARIPPIDNVIYLHSIPYRYLPLYLNTADLFLCLYHENIIPNYRFYNSSMKLFDFMSMAKPILVSNLGQINQVIKHKENGLLTNNSVDDIIRKIIFIKKNKELGLKIGKKARRSVLNYYNWDRMSKDIDKFIKSVYEDGELIK